MAWMEEHLLASALPVHELPVEVVLWTKVQGREWWTDCCWGQQCSVPGFAWRAAACSY